MGEHQGEQVGVGDRVEGGGHLVFIDYYLLFIIYHYYLLFIIIIYYYYLLFIEEGTIEVKLASAAEQSRNVSREEEDAIRSGE